MTNFGLEDIEFEYDYIDYEKNRMYPPIHTGETMKSLFDKHLMALARAKHFVQSGIVKSMTPKMLDSVERDLKLIDEIHTYVRQQIKEPGLPMSPDLVTEPYDGEGHGDED